MVGSPLTPCWTLSRYACSLGTNQDQFYTDWEETYDSFDQMGLHENLLRGIYAYGQSRTLYAHLIHFSACASASAACPQGRRPIAFLAPRCGLNLFTCLVVLIATDISSHT